MKIADLFIKLGLKKEGFDQGINDAKKKTTAFGEAAKKVGGMLAGMFAVGAITSFVSKIIKTRSEFEKYEAVLTNTLGSNKAARQEMQMLQEVAAKTPFSLSELTGAYVKLVNYGLKPTKDEIIKLGDLASSTGKGFDQLTEAVADAVTGQYERLKEFGIKASQSGSRVTFTFKEQRTEVDNNAASIKAYLLSLGELQGVQGAMASISETLGGKISNLGDNWDKLLNTLGKGSSGIFNTVMSWLNSLVETLTWAAMSIADIKQSVLDNSTQSAMEGALSEIEAMKKSLMENGGLSETEAQKRAFNLYYDSIEQRIKELNKSRKEGVSELKKALLAEIQAVKDHYTQLELANKKKQKGTATNKTAVERLSEIAADEKEKEARRILNMEFYGEKASSIPSISAPNKIGESNIDTKTLGNVDGSLKATKEKLEKFRKEEKKAWDDFNEELNQTIREGIGNAVTTMAEGFGQMLGTNTWDWSNFGKQILNTVGQFMQTLGGLFITMGVSMLKFNIALSSMNPFLMIGAGALMVAAGAAISSAASGGIKNSSSTSTASSGGGGYYHSQQAAIKVDIGGTFELHGTTLKAAIHNTERKNNLIR